MSIDEIVLGVTCLCMGVMAITIAYYRHEAEWWEDEANQWRNIAEKLKKGKK